jgi:hypothetical protein
MASARKIYLHGERWTIRHCRVPKTIFGDCDYNTRTIRVSNKLHGEDFLNVLLHEWLHARFPDLSESAVSEVADEVSAMLHAYEFRQPDEQEE